MNPFTVIPFGERQTKKTHFPGSGFRTLRFGVLFLLLLALPVGVYAQAQSYEISPSNQLWSFIVREGETKTVDISIRNTGASRLNVGFRMPPELTGLTVTPNGDIIDRDQSQTFTLTYTAPEGFDEVRQFLHIDVNDKLELFLIEGATGATLGSDVFYEDALLVTRSLDIGLGFAIPAFLVAFASFFLTQNYLRNQPRRSRS